MAASLHRGDIGHRVSVRYRLADARPGEPGHTDVLGVLLGWADGALVVEPRGGGERRVPVDAVVAGKRVPPAPRRRGGTAEALPADDAASLQRIASDGWPPAESADLGEWRLRAAGGFTRRANSALAVGDPGMPVPEALQRVAAWYAERELPALVQVLAGGEIDRAAVAWSAEAETVMRVGALPALALPGSEGVRLSRSPGWVGDGAAAAVLRGGPSVWFAEVPGEGGPVATGRCVVDGPWAGFAAVSVSEEWRRRGLARAVMAALARAALAERATRAYLQVEVGNVAAERLYDSMGLVEHHRYRYRRLPQDT